MELQELYSLGERDKNYLSNWQTSGKKIFGNKRRVFATIIYKNIVDKLIKKTVPLISSCAEIKWIFPMLLSNKWETVISRNRGLVGIFHLQRTGEIAIFKKIGTIALCCIETRSNFFKILKLAAFCYKILCRISENLE